MTTYYPSCVLNFKLRFDEALHIVPEPTPQTTDEAVESAGTSTQSQATTPLILQRGAANTSFLLNRVPMKATAELPGYRQAGTFSAQVSFRDLPIDPRTIRAAAVEVHFGAVPSDQFARGMNNERDGARRLSVLNTRDAAGEPREDTLAMVGLVDEWEVKHTASGSYVSLRGRDLRGVLLDSPLNAQALADLDMGQSIVDVVRQILEFHPLGDEFVVEANPAEWPGGTIPAPLAEDFVPRHRRGARGERSGGRPTPPGDTQQMTYWDAIVRLCFVVGAIPYFRGTSLRVRPTRSIFDQERAGFDPAIPTPFDPDEPRTVDGASFSVRRLVYGREVEDLSFKRQFAGNQRPRAVRCVSLDLSNPARGDEGVLTASWPEATASTDAQSTRSAPGGQLSENEVVTVPVAGIRDVDRLREIARNLYEEIGRNEMTGTCQTRALASFGGSNSDPDLLRLQPGDGVEFLTDTRELASQAPLVATLVDFEREDFETAVRRVVDRIGDENLARVIVATARGEIAEIQRYFRVANVSYDWAADSGVSISFDFQNYFVIRQPANSVGQDPGEVTARTVPRRRTGGT